MIFLSCTAAGEVTFSLSFLNANLHRASADFRPGGVRRTWFSDKPG